MKVKELIKKLKEEKQEAIVIMSKDGEGNSYSPLADFGDTDVYQENSTWDGEIGYSKLTPELIKAGYGEEDIIENGKPALVIFPTN